MTCVEPQVRPLSLLTAQYTLCPCAPSNHLPTPCRGAIGDHISFQNRTVFSSDLTLYTDALWSAHHEMQIRLKQRCDAKASRRSPCLEALTQGEIACRCHLFYRGALAHMQTLMLNLLHELLVQGVYAVHIDLPGLQLSQNARANVKPLGHGVIETQSKQARTCHWAAMEPLGRCASVAMWL